MDKVGYSLRWRLFMAYCGLTAAVLLSLTFYFTTRQSAVYRLGPPTNLETLAQQLVQDAPNLINNPAALENALAERASGSHYEALILDASGQIRLDTRSMEALFYQHDIEDQIQQGLQGNTNSGSHFNILRRQQVDYAVAPLWQDGAVEGVLRLSVPLQNEEAVLPKYWWSAARAALLTIFIMVALAFLLSYYGMRPLMLLTAKVEDLLAGAQPELDPSNDLEEINQLGQAFNRLIRQRNSQIEALQSDGSKLNTVLTHMTDGLLIIDPDGIIQLINPAALRMFNVKEDQALASSIVEVLRHHKLVELWHQSLSTREQHADTLEIKANQLSIYGIAIPLQDAMPGHTLMVFQDLTHVRRLEKIRSDFVSNVSHELRTPLASLKALAETLSEGALDDPPAALNFLKRMDGEIDNLTQIVQELLELSRIESGQTRLDLHRVPASQLGRSAVERMRVQAERAGVALHIDFDDNLPAVLADAQRIQQVIINLVHNAIKFTPPGGSIHASASHDAGRVVFSIRDSGVGISAENLPRIFERFYKTDPARSSGGTGLGLSISRHLIEAHHGKIWAESTAEQGSTFYFSLPVA